MPLDPSLLERPKLVRHSSHEGLSTIKCNTQTTVDSEDKMNVWKQKKSIYSTMHKPISTGSDGDCFLEGDVLDK